MMTDEQIIRWIDACNHEPSRQLLRDYMAMRDETSRKTSLSPVDRAFLELGANASAEEIGAYVMGRNASRISQPQPVAQGEAKVVTLAEAERVAHHAYVAGKRGYTFTGFVDELRSAATPTIPTGHRVVPVDDTKDAARWKALVRGLRNGFPGTGHGKRIKVIEVCPMYGDETMVTDIAGFIDAASPSAGGV